MINKREIRDFEFTDRAGKLVRPTKEEACVYAQRKKRQERVRSRAGEAYAFFNCRASKDEIDKELPDIRDAVRTPNQLELSLTEGINPEIFKHQELISIAQDAKKAGIRYFMRASYRGASNKETADELVGILNQAYQSSLYQDKEEFRGEIFYEENGHYVNRE